MIEWNDWAEKLNEKIASVSRKLEKVLQCQLRFNFYYCKFDHQIVNTLHLVSDFLSWSGFLCGAEGSRSHRTRG